jgi:hypothetical protein
MSETASSEQSLRFEDRWAGGVDAAGPGGGVAIGMV